VVPDELGTTSKLTNAFNGTVVISQASSTTGGDKKAFTLTFNGLSREACITLATNDWGSGYSSGLIYIKAASDEIKTYDDTEKDTGLIGCKGDTNTACPGGSVSAVPMPVGTAATACGCKTGNKCSIQWKYY
ncbi:MAG: type 4 pilus major pilin, partial [Alphaproteobacteria bacterium]